MENPAESAKKFKDLVNRERDAAKRYFAPFTEVFKGCGKVLELASGQGYFLEMLRDAGIGTTGLELEADLCEPARLRGLDVVNADFFDFLKAAEPGSFDGCFASHIVEHFLPSRVEEMLALVHKALKHGSPFVILTPNISNMRRSTGDFWRDPTHVRPYPVQALSIMLKKQGWDIVKSGEHTDRPPSLSRKIKYGIRNILFGRYWTGDDIYVIARKP